MTDQVAEQAEKVDPESKQAREKLRRPDFNFTEMGVPKGSELVFVEGSEHKCRVVDDKRVEYEGEVFRLTPLTVQLLEYPRTISPLRHWLYNGENLSQIYERTYRGHQP